MLGRMGELTYDKYKNDNKRINEAAICINVAELPKLCTFACSRALIQY